MTTNQKKLLRMLFDKYERSKTCIGDNKVSQQFRCIQADINNAFPDYYSDHISFDVKSKYDREMDELCSLGYVTVVRDYGEVVTVTMINDKYPEYCRILGIIGKLDRLSAQKQVFEKYRGKCCLVDKICDEQLGRLLLNKDNTISKNLDKLDKMLECLCFIVDNEFELLERELSVIVFSDSKVFAAEYESKICKLLLQYDDYSDVIFDDSDEDIVNDIILAKYNISKNPTYVYFKGNGKIIYSNGYSVSFVSNVPIAINSHTLTNITGIDIYDNNIMTVENLTSYNRLQSDDTFLLYLGGYNNKAKSDLLKLVYGFNSDKKWFHFGDIDPDGFHILKNLINKTEIPFVSYNMNKEQLIKYDKYAKNFEKNDFQKAESLKSSEYADVVNYMFDTKRKLEQEIISWKEPVVKIL